MKIKIHKIKSPDGFSLLEVLISMVILGVALLGLLNMSLVALTSNDWSNKTTVVTQSIQQKLEELRNTPNPSNGSEEINGIELNWTVSSPQNHLREVYLTAMWQDMISQYKYMNVTAYMKTDSL